MCCTRWSIPGFGWHDDRQPPNHAVASWRLLLRNPVTVRQRSRLGIVVIVAVAANWITPFGVNDVDVPSALRAAEREHWFGTDELGRDVLSRVLGGDSGVDAGRRPSAWRSPSSLA